MYVITNRNLCSERRYLDVIEDCIRFGVDNLIIREKDLENNDLETLCIKIKEIRDRCNVNSTNLLINSNLGLYEKLNLDGLHLPFNIFLDLIKNNYEFNKNKILGLSLHKIDEVKILEKIRKDKEIRVDYIILSHIYETKCKENLKPKGTILLKEARKLTDLKIVALGGILPSNIKNTLMYSDDFAIMSTIMQSENTKDTIKKYLQQI